MSIKSWQRIAPLIGVGLSVVFALSCRQESEEDAAVPHERRVRLQKAKVVTHNESKDHSIHKESDHMKLKDPHKVWAKILSERDDLDDSDASKVAYMKEILANHDDLARFDYFAFLIPLMDDPSQIFECVTLLRKNSKRDRVWGDSQNAFMAAVTTLGKNQADVYCSYIKELKNDHDRQKLGNLLVRHFLSEQDLKLLKKHISLMAGGGNDSKVYWSEVASRLTTNLRIGWPVTKSRQLRPGLIEEILQFLPETERKEISLDLVVKDLNGSELSRLGDISNRSGYTKMELTVAALHHDKVFKSMSPQNALSWFKVLPMENNSRLSHLTGRLMQKILEAEDQSLMIRQVSSLPAAHQKAAFLRIGMELNLASGRQKSYDYATNLSGKQLGYFLEGVKLMWEEGGQAGPDYSEFEKLSKRKPQQ